MLFPLFRCAHFAIYDGHGGRLAAEYARKHLHDNVLSAGLPRELVCLLSLVNVGLIFVATIGQSSLVA